MAKTAQEQQFLMGLIDQTTLFNSLFSEASLIARFEEKFSYSSGKGTDRLNGFQFSARAPAECHIASEKCLAGTYKFAPYLENLKTKGRSSPPRLIGIPIVRDRIVLSQLNRFLAAVYPERVPKNIASAYVREISEDLKGKKPAGIWVCSTDIKTFYNSIQPDQLLRVLEKRIDCWQALRLVGRALQTPTVPRNTKRARHRDYRTSEGVPQGLAISNILASIYMQDVDDGMSTLGLTYYRYVDDVLMYGKKDEVEKALRSLRARLVPRGLRLHSAKSGKTGFAPLKNGFSYLGYDFKWPHITVRDATVERFLQSIAAKFSDYVHNKKRRLEKIKYLTEARVAEIFLMELNERISGAVSEKKRYGWIAYFNQITDLSLLHRLDRVIAKMFERMQDFGGAAPVGLKKLSRAYFEMRFNPGGGYVRNYDKIVSYAEKIKFLEERGRVGPGEALTDDEIDQKYDTYVRHVLATMHADESVLYG